MRNTWSFSSFGRTVGSFSTLGSESIVSSSSFFAICVHSFVSTGKILVFMEIVFSIGTRPFFYLLIKLIFYSLPRKRAKLHQCIAVILLSCQNLQLIYKTASLFRLHPQWRVSLKVRGEWKSQLVLNFKILNHLRTKNLKKTTMISLQISI